MAASVILPVAAAAQTVAPPVKWEDVPAAPLKAPAAPAPIFRPAPPPAAPGVSWQQAAPPPAAKPATPVAPQATARPTPRAMPAPARPAPVPAARADVRPVQQAAPMAQPAAGAPLARQRHHRMGADGHSTNPVVAHRNGDRMARGFRGRNRYASYSRIDRGFALPHYWWGPAFTIDNWNQYGLSQPMHGGRWVRYYDDALLVDAHGRVHDGRWDMSWDEYGDEWGYNERGIPIYVGDGDFYPEDEDYAWAREHEGYGGYQQAYGYPAYGYGAVVTETTVTTEPSVVTETHYVDEVVHSAPRRGNRVKAYRSKIIR